MPLDLSGKGLATDHAIDICAREIFQLLSEFDSPKDAGSAITLAYWFVIKAAFPPEYRTEAKEAVDASMELIKTFIDEGWQ